MSQPSEEDRRPGVLFVHAKRRALDGLQRVLTPRHSARWRMSFHDDTEAAHLAIIQEKPHVVVVDEQLNEVTGEAFAETSARRQRGPHKAHTILMSSQAWQHELAVDDQVAKPVKLNALVARITLGVRLKTQAKDLMKARAKLRMEGMSDPLTGVASRQRAMQYLRQELARVRRKMEGCGLAVFDLDHFGAVNAAHGEAQGDTVLVDVAKILQNAGRQYDLVARWTADSFVVVLPGTDQAGATAATERLTRAMSMLKWQAHGQRFGVTASVGLLILPSGVRTDAEQAVKWALDGVCRAKRAGGDQLALVAPPVLVA